MCWRIGSSLRIFRQVHCWMSKNRILLMFNCNFWKFFDNAAFFKSSNVTLTSTQFYDFYRIVIYLFYYLKSWSATLRWKKIWLQALISPKSTFVLLNASTKVRCLDFWRPRKEIALPCTPLNYSDAPIKLQGRRAVYSGKELRSMLCIPNDLYIWDLRPLFQMKKLIVLVS